jgi:rhodanese-related sulfurtransferase
MNWFSKFLGPVLPSINALELKGKLAGPDPVFLLDVREPDEYRAGHITGATLIPLGELQQRVDELPKTKTVVCVCHTGSRSTSATRFLLSAGLNVLNMKHGMIAWQMARLPVVTGMSKRGK